MIESGSAQTVMGNHEYNAICFATPNPDLPTDYLRTHIGAEGEKNFHQHAAFLNETQYDAVLYQELITFFKSLPLWLDIDDIRIVHACWNEQQQNNLKPFINSQNNFTDTGIIESAQHGGSAFNVAELLLNYLELPLPKG